MRLGALLGPIADPSDGKALAEQANWFEAEGYSSLWAPQAIGRGFMISDPFVILATAAAVTESVELGTAVLQLPLYQAMDVAHRAYSLQQASGNRFIFGVGAGSTEQDFAAYERDYESRFQDFTASVESLREIFATGGHGGSTLSPWPALTGGPPLFLGSWGNGVVRAAREFDGWIASAHYRTPEEVVTALGRYREAGGGRAVVSTIQVAPDADLGELADKLDTFADAGFDDAVVMLLPGGHSPEEIRRLVG